jgi:RimJ/RimL family protein N-acetyltransferase
MPGNYLFTSSRLGFRNWREHDIAALAGINADPQVMEFFPETKTYAETGEFVKRMQQQFAERGYCYFAVDKLEDGEFIGFIGLSYQAYDADFTPCTDIGWRLNSREWHKGYAAEGALRCLEYGLNELALKEICAVAPRINTRSEHVMKKIGMSKVCDFIHPLLTNDDRLKECVRYKIEKTED